MNTKVKNLSLADTHILWRADIYIYIYIYTYIYIWNRSGNTEIESYGTLMITQTHMHTYIHTYRSTYIQEYIHTYIQEYIHTYIHTCT